MLPDAALPKDRFCNAITLSRVKPMSMLFYKIVKILPVKFAIKLPKLYE